MTINAFASSFSSPSHAEITVKSLEIHVFASVLQGVLDVFTLNRTLGWARAGVTTGRVSLLFLKCS
jgi:hypothetical protein